MAFPNAVPTRGAIISVDPVTNQQCPPINFQFNPASIRRTLQPSVLGGQPGGHSESVRFTGAPTEVFTLEIELDCFNDGLPSAAVPSGDGLYPVLYALELLVYPSVQQFQSQQRQLQSGVMEIGSIEVPLVLLAWGTNRVVPVALQSFSIVEQAFNAALNPVRAVVSLTARVLSFNEVTLGTTTASYYSTYQKSKETLKGRV